MIYVDPLITATPPSYISEDERPDWERSCHLFSSNEQDLHIFARRLGLKREQFQNKKPNPLQWHYVLNPNLRKKAISRGAMAVTSEQLAIHLSGGEITLNPGCEACRTPVVLFFGGAWTCYNCLIHKAIYQDRDDVERDRIYKFIDEQKRMLAA